VATSSLLDRNDAPSNQSVSAMMRLLASGVPLTLLLDLLNPAGPDSCSIMRAEACPLN
jgi:hypothetical protein